VQRDSEIVAATLDAKVWDWVLGVIQRPEIIEQQLRLDEQGGYADTIEGYRSRIANLDRQQAQLAKAMGLLGDSEMEHLVAQYRLTSEQKAEAERELIELLDQQSQFETWQAKMHEVTEWSESVKDLEWTYERKRQALYAFKVEVIVWRTGSEKRWMARIGRRKAPKNSASPARDFVPSRKPDGHAEEVLNYIETH